MHACPGGGRGAGTHVNSRARTDAGGLTRAPREYVRWLAFALTAIVSTTPCLAHADEPWLLDLEGTVGAPITAPQNDWYGVGGSLAAGISRPLAPWVLLDARLRGALFADGETPTVPGVKDPGVGSLTSLTFGVTFRVPDGSTRRATGPWIGAGIGPALTGEKVRASWEAGLGYGFGITDSMALGPVVRFVQVIQPNGDELSASDARLILGGLRLSLFDKGAPPPPPPPTDRDSDGIFDDSDRCPDAAEDKDGFQDDDGCPEEDNDLDGILDQSDRCPDVAEDKDGFEDDDGCPDEDNDKDGILDQNDQCPLEPETVNGERDDDGCPDEGLIEMRDGQVVLEERVLFDVNVPRLKRGAEPVLKAIVKLQQLHPEWKKVRIEGHADVRGPDDFNQRLSEQRAENVRAALVRLGVPDTLMVAEGRGASQPLNNDKTEEGYRANRRVAFVVVAAEPVSTSPVPSPVPSANAPSTEPAPVAAPVESTPPSSKGQTP
jgi:outer membrane protein OmpA-like peptidoglycan-associated protein